MPLDRRQYRIDFFQLSIVANGEIASADDVFRAILDGNLAAVAESGGFTREVYELAHRGRPNSYTGQFRKFRTYDLPEIGAAGDSAHELELLEGQGLIERNFFVFYAEHSLIGWHVNGHGSTQNQLAKFLGAITGQQMRVDPVPVAGALERLMAGDVITKKITATIARPTNAAMMPDDDYSSEFIRLLSGFDGDSLHISIGIDARRGDSAGRLTNRAKDALRALAASGATTARADVIEDGIEHPIDLLLDRVKSFQYAESDSKYPSRTTMFTLIDLAHRESLADFQCHFGQGNRVLD